MADIFLSYAEEDREVARKISALLEFVGWSVWWDRRIPAGKTWRAVLEEALQDMRCMIVLWSHSSITSEWVKEEAEEGRSQGKLVPILIEPVKPPVGFRSIQAADLAHWDGSNTAPGVRQLIGDLEAVLGKPQQAPANEVGATYPTQGADPVRSPAGNQDIQPSQAGGSSRDHAGTGVHRFARAMALWPYVVIAIFVVLMIAIPFQRWKGESTRAPGASLDSPVSGAKEDPTSMQPAAAPSEKPPAGLQRPTEASPVAGTARAPAKIGSSVSRQSAKVDVSRGTTTQDSPNERSNSRRCADILARVQLGETLSDTDRDFLQKECGP